MTVLDDTLSPLKVLVVIAIVVSLLAFGSIVWGASFAIVSADLDKDEYYKTLDSLNSGKVTKYTDADGVPFYSVVCWNDCKIPYD